MVVEVKNLQIIDNELTDSGHYGLEYNEHSQLNTLELKRKLSLFLF